MEEKDWLLFFGVFFAETVKNAAKGTANIIQRNISNLLNTEITALNLNSYDSTEVITQKLEAHPQIKEQIQRKLESNPDLLNEVVSVLQTVDSGITINATKIAQVNINPQHVEQKIENF